MNDTINASEDDMPEKTPAPRLDYIDNLRSTMIFLVVAMHAAVTYSHFGRWYYSAPEPIGRLDGLAFGMFQSHLQAFFMGLLFLVAGYFTPTAYDRKGLLRFLLDRFVRLGLPALLFVFVIHDTMGHYLLHWHGNDGFWHSYAYYLSHGDWIDGTGPMWFAVVLLFFSLVYTLVRAVVPRMKFALKAPGAAGVLLGGLAMAGLTFFSRTVWPVGTAFHNMQFCYFAQYVVLFAVGIAARRGGWLAAFPAKTGYRMLWGAVIAGPLVWIGILIAGGVFAQGLAPFNGGWHWQSAALAVWEQVFAAAMCAGLLVLFRETFNSGGRLSKLMSANSFGIYLFHPPVLVAISLALAGWGAPPLVKAVTVALLAFFATLAVVHLLVRRIPLLNRIV
jgi:glucans biosynthesis protein C